MDMININKRATKLTILILIFLFILVFILKPNYRLSHIYSVNKKYIVTRIEYSSILFGNKTYFTSGKITENNIPQNYINPIYSGFNSGFELIIYWENDKCVFASYLDNFDINCPDSSFEFRKISIDEFMKYKNNNSGKFIYQVEREIF